MSALLGDGRTLVAESGISNTDTIVELREAGFSGFLIGETFMRTSDPGKSCANFIAQLKTVKRKLKTV
jgi:indole-3-glycerol phosphate synthase